MLFFVVGSVHINLSVSAELPKKNNKKQKFSLLLCARVCIFYTTESILRIYRARTSGRGSDREKESEKETLPQVRKLYFQAPAEMLFFFIHLLLLCLSAC